MWIGLSFLASDVTIPFGSTFVEGEVGEGAGGLAVGVVGVCHEVDADDFGGFFTGVAAFEVFVEVAGFWDPGVEVFFSAFGDNTVPFVFQHAKGDDGGF